jgi:uncharacterized protein with HEPN domain
MRPEARKLLRDALDACEAIQRFVHGLTLDDYAKNELVTSAVERQFEILGEAISRLRQVDAAVAQRIPEVGRVVDFRNVLIHRYADIDDAIVWGVVEGKLPALRAAIQAMLAEQ